MPSEKLPTDSENPEMFRPAPVARQVQAARDAQAGGRIVARTAQRACDAGLFAPLMPDQPSMF
jgi:hypothetical protein